MINEEKALLIEKKIRLLLDLVVPDKPGFQVHAMKSQDKLIFNIIPAKKDDTAYFIGRGGRVVAALRTISSIIGAQQKVNTEIYIID